MDKKQLLYAVGAVMPHDQIKKNDASHFRAGFLGSKIYTDQEQQLLDAGIVKKLPVYDRVLGRKERHIKETENWTEVFKGLNFRTKHIREAAAGTAERLSLVKGRKSRTGRHRVDKWQEITRYMAPTLTHSYSLTELSSPEVHDNHYAYYALAANGSAKVLRGKEEANYSVEPSVSPIALHFMHREWNNTYKFQVKVDTSPSNAPEPQSGERYTEKLSSRSVTRIFEAAAYTAIKHDGFKTFLTPTFSKWQRNAIFGSMTDGEGYKNAGAHSPIVYKRHMVTTRAKKGQKKIWDPICDVAGEYWTIPTKDTPFPKVMNRGGVVAGDYCLLSQKPEQEFSYEKVLDTTIGKENTRLLDGLKKMFQRGWWASHTVRIDPDSGCEYSDLTPVWVEGHIGKPSEFGPTQKPKDFHYIWVAECPMNEDGEPNPHSHILLGWEVEKHLFSAWSKRIEQLWGNGFAKLERIKKPKAAGSYIIKAVGYAAKGANADQGLIKGNRYSIASCSRAPGWDSLATFDVDNITAVIKELGHKLEQWKKPLTRQVRKLNKQKAQTIVAKSIAIKEKKPTDYQKRLQHRIIRLEKQAEKINKTIKERGVHASTQNRFCITFEGDSAKEKADDFIYWAAGARGWSMQCRDVDLSDIKSEADEQHQGELIRFKERCAYWKSVIEDDDWREEDIDEDEIDHWRTIQADYLEGRLEPMLC